jgi:spore germination protein KA
MFGFLLKKLRFLKELAKSKSQDHKSSAAPESKLSSSLNRNLNRISQKLGDSPDIINRQFMIGHSNPQTAVILFIDGLVDQKTINENILRPLLSIDEVSSLLTPEMFEQYLLTVGGIKQVQDFAGLVEGILTGDTALLLDGSSTGLLLSTKGWEKRSIREPDMEVIIKGPRDGFTENLRTNTALLRRRIEHPSLRFDAIKIGKKTRTDINIAYIQGLANPDLVNEVKRRIQRIDTDGILAAGFIEQFIEDAPFSIFATVGYTERPDVCCAKLMEGRVAILTDGTPVVNTVPFLFVESFQSPDDYNFRPFYMTLVRWFRYSAFVISILLPPVYVALSSYHQELIPTPLLISMAAATEGTPFPALVEAIGMGFIFEILREAGIRIPRPYGQAVSIVGALVIGDATVSAGLVGAPLVIVVAFTAIASFLVPTLADVAAVLRVILTILAGILGAFGLNGGLIVIYVHLASLRSFGVPYLSPLAPLMPKDLKDVAVRAPLWAMFSRPKALDSEDQIRQEFKLRPHPPDDGEEA